MDRTCIKYDRSSVPQIILNHSPACTIKEDHRRDGKDFFNKDNFISL